jgi:hypothetical protein
MPTDMSFFSLMCAGMIALLFGLIVCFRNENLITCPVRFRLKERSQHAHAQHGSLAEPHLGMLAPHSK